MPGVLRHDDHLRIGRRRVRVRRRLALGLLRQLRVQWVPDAARALTDGQARGRGLMRLLRGRARRLVRRRAQGRDSLDLCGARRLVPGQGGDGCVAARTGREEGEPDDDEHRDDDEEEPTHAKHAPPEGFVVLVARFLLEELVEWSGHRRLLSDPDQGAGHHPR